MDEPIRESGPRLAVLLAPALRTEGPLYRALADGLKRAIDRGEVPLGTVLPPERTLARSLSVSRATVVAAYDRLKDEGWLQSRRGSGTWVRRPQDPTTPPGVDAVATARLFLSEDGLEQRSGPGQRTQAPEGVIDLSVAALPGSATVDRVLSSATLEEVRSLTEHHGYLPQGLRALRERVALLLGTQGLTTGADHVVVTTGAHQAISLVARQTLAPGAPVLVETPTFPGALDVFRRFGARAFPVPVDEHGVRVDVLEELVHRAEPKLLYLSPHFHNPTGVVLAEDRRRRIGELAAAHDLVVIEDLAMGDLALDDVPVPPPIAALAPEAQVHTIGSTAKLYWAGLRVGWIRSPDDWAARMLATKTVADLGTPLLSQLLAVKLLDHAEEVLAERREQLRPRRDLLAERIATQLPDWSFRLPHGGLSLWLTLPDGNADELAEVALRHGVLVVPGPALSVDDGNRRCVRVVFTRPEHELIEGVDRLAAAWAAYAPTTERSAARLLV